MAQTNKTWGGRWTEKKLDAFEKYVKAYLTIMNVRRDKNDWKLLYFDGFAGSGVREKNNDSLDDQQLSQLFGQEITVEEINVYQGAAERVVQIEEKGTRGFDRYYFIDKSQDNCTALETKLSKYNTSGKRYHLNIDANEAVKKLAGTLCKNNRFKALAFLDPFGMQIEWTALESMRNLSVDLWILVPTGVIVNRLLERDFDQKKGLAHAEKLESFFGIPAESIRQFFYTESSTPTLFDEDAVSVKKTENPIKRIAELYVDRLKSVFKFVTPEPLALYNNHGVPIYHFVFAANNKTAMKIAQEIISKQ